jgi:hypothetical protein
MEDLFDWRRVKPRWHSRRQTHVRRFGTFPGADRFTGPQVKAWFHLDRDFALAQTREC